MSQTKEFSLASVLGVTTGYALVDKAMIEIQELMEWIVGISIFTHQLPGLKGHCAEALNRQLPHLNPAENASLKMEVERLVGVIRDKGRRDQAEMEAHIWRKLKAKYGDSFRVKKGER